MLPFTTENVVAGKTRSLHFGRPQHRPCTWSISTQTSANDLQIGQYPSAVIIPGSRTCCVRWTAHFCGASNDKMSGQARRSSPLRCALHLHRCRSWRCRYCGAALGELHSLLATPVNPQRSLGNMYDDCQCLLSPSSTSSPHNWALRFTPQCTPSQKAEVGEEDCMFTTPDDTPYSYKPRCPCWLLHVCVCSHLISLLGPLLLDAMLSF